MALTFVRLLLVVTLASVLTHVSLLALMGRDVFGGARGFVAWLNSGPQKTERYRDIMDRPRRAGRARPPAAHRPRKLLRPVPLVPEYENPPSQHLAPFPAPLGTQRLHTVGYGRRVRVRPSA